MSKSMESDVLTTVLMKIKAVLEKSLDPMLKATNLLKLRYLL